MRVEYFNKLVSLIKDSNIDAMLIAPSDDMQFLIGYNPSLCERFQGLIVKSTGEYLYICNLLTQDEIQKVLGENVKVYSWFDGDIFTDTVKIAFEEHELSGKKIGINSTVRGFNMIQIQRATAVEFIDCRSILEELRIIKSPKELHNLKESAKIADETFLQLIKQIEVGMSEKEIKDICLDIFKKKGASRSYGIVASGVNTAYPHYHDDKAIIKEKDIIILDIGCVYNEMCSDMTRTIFVGSVTEEERKLYNIVLRANDAGTKAAKNGAFIPDVDRAARSIIHNEGYGQYFTTRLGHGIGYGVHEAPDIKKSNERYLQKGMAFSIEPGIYIPGKMGIRIEDIVVITDNECEIINRATKEIIVLK